MNKIILLLTLLALGISDAFSQYENGLVMAPADKQYTHIDVNGETILPNGRIIKPAGKQVKTAPHPYGLVLSPDGKVAVTANSGTSPLSLTIISKLDTENPEVRQIPPGVNTDKGVLASVFMGLAISPDNEKVYAAGGQENKIYIFNIKDGSSAGSINCKYKDKDHDYSHGYIGDMVMSKDGSTLYAVDQINFRLVIIDVHKKSIIHNVQVGRYPFGVTLSPDEKFVYVANVGMYQYNFIKSFDPKRRKETAVDFPTSGYLTLEGAVGYKNGKVEVPGLGDPHSPEAFSVFKIDLTKEKPAVTKKFKTGFKIGQKIDGIPALGGSSPNSLVATDKYVFVSNGNNDCISVIDIQKDTIIQNIFIKPHISLNKYRGIIPFGLALSPDSKTLFVAEAGINAVGVIDIASMKLTGHIPVGWFPSKLKVTPDGKKLIVANAKGYGSGPNTGPDFHKGPEGSNIGRLMKGTVSIIEIPSGAMLAEYSEKVLAYNFKFITKQDSVVQQRMNNPVPFYPYGPQSPIKHIVFIAKENRNYDDIFGQLEKGKGLAEAARFGKDVSVTNESRSKKIKSCTVMPNHLALAKRFSIGDNFYCDSDHSADGHRWLACTYPNEWVETGVSASYGSNRDWIEDSPAPGVHAMVGSNSSVYPEDYNEAGTLWDHLDRNKLSFFNFGMGVEMNPGYEDKDFIHTGVKNILNYPVPNPLFNNSSMLYATFNMAIPDQYRADMFFKEFNDRWIGKGKSMPAILTLSLPNDHGAAERAKDGYPYLESYMADNDLALGRIVEYLSHTPYWKNMLIVVTEDDPQGGVDHIDAHRSILMTISPYSKKNYIGHYHYSFGSIFKTFWNILRVPYINQYDAGATDMFDLFTDKPDFTPYKATDVDHRLFDAKKVLTPLDPKFNWKAMRKMNKMDDPDDMEENSRKLDLKKEQERRNSNR